jgi:phage-related protein
LTDEQFTISSEGNHEIERLTGNADSEPVYQLKGTINSSSSTYISITTNGEELRVVGALTADEVLVIDSGLVTAKITDTNGNTLRNGLPGLDELNFPVLHKGDNEIAITVAGATFSELRILAKSRWR